VCVCARVCVCVYKRHADDVKSREKLKITSLKLRTHKHAPTHTHTRPLVNLLCVRVRAPPSAHSRHMATAAARPHSGITLLTEDPPGSPLPNVGSSRAPPPPHLLSPSSYSLASSVSLCRSFLSPVSFAAAH